VRSTSRPSRPAGRGAATLFWLWHEGVGNSAGKLGNGVDIRGEGGYAILPPSRRADGRRYQWVEDCGTPIAAPAWLAELITKPKHDEPRQSGNGVERDSNWAHVALERECAGVASAAEGLGSPRPRTRFDCRRQKLPRPCEPS
jgi:hypothetical protein